MTENKYTLIAVELEFLSRWAMGGMSTDVFDIDLPVVRNPLTGEPWLPGASVAGSLRAHLGGRAETWLGRSPEGFEETGRGNELERSRLAVLGCVLGECPGEPISNAGATAVDSRRGAAKGGSLRTYEWAAPRRVIVAFEQEGEQDEALLDALACWHPSLGRGRGAGLGQTRVLRVAALSVDLGDVAGLDFWLGDRRAWYANPTAVAGCAWSERRGVEAGGGWRRVPLVVREPLRVGTGKRVEAGKPLPALRRRADEFLVPGSSWKGVFRHRVEYILGALGCTGERAQGIIDVLFGSQQLGRGMLWFGESALRVRAPKKRTHIAIDRFTGGVRHGATYSTESAPPGTELDFCWRWEDGEAPAAVANLVGHVLRDLHDGLASVGAMGSRGYGWVEVREPGLFDGLRAVDVAELAAALDNYHPAKERDDNE